MKPSLAETLAGNHLRFESFAWRSKPEDSQNWGLYTLVTRDSDLLEQSNSDAIQKEFEEKFPESDNYYVGSFGHWACGWVEHLCIKVYTDNTQTETTEEFKLLEKLINNLDDYPILDDEDFCNREYEDTIQNLESELRSATNDLEEQWEEDHQNNNDPMPKIPDVGEIYSWFSNNCQSAIESSDGFGGYASKEEIMEAIEGIWEENEKQRLIDIEIKSGQQKLF
jgi:hypothetical protein